MESAIKSEVEPQRFSVMFADIVNSTGIKETQPEPAWIRGTLFLYEACYESLEPTIRDVAWIKGGGDSMMVAVPVQYTAHLLRTAINLLGRISDGNKGRAGAKGIIDYDITVGVASGPTVEVSMPSGARDYIGSVPDRASRLSGIASPNALLVDSPTVAAADMAVLSSPIGEALDRAPEDYLGPRESVQLRGFTQKTGYHEILWAKQLFGVKSANLTSTTERLEAVTRVGTRGESATEPHPKGSGEGHMERKAGALKMWDKDRQFGFAIDDETGEEFHFVARHVVYQEDCSQLTPGTRLAWVAGPPSSRRREAVAILVVDQDAEGFIIATPGTKPHGWVKVCDMAGNAHLVFVPGSQFTPDLQRGTVVHFRVRGGSRGIHATELQQAVDVA